MGYTLFVDESGEEGFQKIRTSSEKGSSPWFSLGAFLMKDTDREIVLNCIDECKAVVKKKELHATDLQHKQKVFVCQRFSKLPITFFGLLSNKSSLERGNYRSRIEGETWKYYNKNAGYLLEKVGRFLDENNITKSEHKIIFEEKRSVHYGSMKNFLKACWLEPHYKEAEFLQYINIPSITAVPKKEEPLFVVADFIAHSLFQCCEDADNSVTETRYLNELRSNFYSDDNGEIFDFGIKAVNKISDLQLQQQDQSFILNLNAK